MPFYETPPFFHIVDIEFPTGMSSVWIKTWAPLHEMTNIPNTPIPQCPPPYTPITPDIAAFVGDHDGSWAFLESLLHTDSPGISSSGTPTFPAGGGGHVVPLGLRHDTAAGEEEYPNWDGVHGSGGVPGRPNRSLAVFAESANVEVYGHILGSHSCWGFASPDPPSTPDTAYLGRPMYIEAAEIYSSGIVNTAGITATFAGNPVIRQNTQINIFIDLVQIIIRWKFPPE